MIKLENIQKVFRTEEVETVALGGVSLEVKKGEFVAIMGPSGCGKSTLLNILGLLDNPTSGTYMLDGENVGQLKESQRTKVRKGKIGFVFQSFNLIDEMNVEENVELPLTYLGVPKKERKTRVEEVLRRMAISHRAHHFPQQLSGGQQQRVAIARMFIKNPSIIILDEPTASLDAIATEQIKASIDAIKEGRTVIVISHNIGQIVDADQLYMLEQGRVVESGKPDEVYKQGGRYKEIFDASARSMNADRIADVLDQ